MLASCLSVAHDGMYPVSRNVPADNPDATHCELQYPWCQEPEVMGPFFSEVFYATYQKDWVAFDWASALKATEFDNINDTTNIRHFEANHTCLWSGGKEERPSASNTLYRNIHLNLIFIDFKMQFFKYSFDFYFS